MFSAQCEQCGRLSQPLQRYDVQGYCRRCALCIICATIQGNMNP